MDNATQRALRAETERKGHPFPNTFSVLFDWKFDRELSIGGYDVTYPVRPVPYLRLLQSGQHSVPWRRVSVTNPDLIASATDAMRSCAFEL